MNIVLDCLISFFFVAAIVMLIVAGIINITGKVTANNYCDELGFESVSVVEKTFWGVPTLVDCCNTTDYYEAKGTLYDIREEVSG